MSDIAPADWRSTTLGEVTRERRERVGGGAAPVVLSSTKHYGLVPSDDFFKNRRIYSADLSNYKATKRGWFAYATNHLAEGSIGLQAQYDLACVSPIYTVFSCESCAEPRYLFRFLKWPRTMIVYQIHEQASVNRRGSIGYSAFATIPIVLPPLPEQRGIVAVLDVVDEAIKSAEQLIAKLALTRQGILADLLGLGFGEKGRLGAGSEAFRFVTSNYGRFPMDWALGALGQRVLSIDAGHSPDVPDIPAARGQWAVLKVSAVKPDGFQSSENKALQDQHTVNEALEIHDGDLLMTRANTSALVGLTCIVATPRSRLLLSDKTLRLNLDMRRAVPQFVALALQSPFARRQIEVNGTGSSGSMKNISQREICEIVLAWPSVSEQRRIADRVEVASRRLRSAREDLAKLRHLRLGLVDDLLTGRIRVNTDVEDWRDGPTTN